MPVIEKSPGMKKKEKTDKKRSLQHEEEDQVRDILLGRRRLDEWSGRGTSRLLAVSVKQAKQNTALCILAPFQIKL